MKLYWDDVATLIAAVVVIFGFGAVIAGVWLDTRWVITGLVCIVFGCFVFVFARAF